MNCKDCSSLGVKKNIVALMTLIRRNIGDAAFFQALPLLSIPQRRLLDAYISIG